MKIMISQPMRGKTKEQIREERAELVKQLEAEGLVKYIPRTGVVVNRITKEDVIEIYKIRSSLELLVATEAMKHIQESDVNRIHKLLDETEIANKENNIEEVMNTMIALSDIIKTYLEG